MDFGRASFLFQRVLKGFFPNGKLTKETQAGARTLDFKVELNNRIINFSLVEASEPWVGIDFEWIEPPPGSLRTHARRLQSGTLEMAHALKDVVSAFAQVGLGVHFYPSDDGEDERQQDARGRIYDRVLTHRGFRRLNRPGDVMNYYRPTKVA
jgi:hypothetical protein